MAKKICIEFTDEELAYIKDGLITFLGSVKNRHVVPNYPETVKNVRKVLKDLGAI